MDKWKRLAEKLSGLYLAHATIVADGHTVSFYKRVHKEKLVIETFVDGYFKGKWMNVKDGKPEYSEGRFFRPRKKANGTKKEYSALKRIFGKKKADEMVTPKLFMVDPCWGSPRTLIAHLKREFPDLEIVEDSSHG